ncbi:MAG: hypothetical protein AAGI30_00155 [Planctomycetota bacterium]
MNPCSHHTSARMPAVLAGVLTVGTITGAQSPILLTGWHTPDFTGASQPVNDSTPDVLATGVAATLGSLQGGFEVRTDFNSADATFGTIAIPGGPAGIDAVSLRTNTDQQRRLDVSITNTSAQTLVLDRLHFDYGRSFEGGPRMLSVFVLTGEGDLTVDGFPSVFVDNDTPVIPFEATDYPDVDADLTVLSDFTLAPGETAAFRFQAADAAGPFTGLVIDNVAFTGTFETVAPRITVDPTDVLAPLAGRTGGLNTLYVTDDAARREPGARPLTDALNDLGSRALRFPGGEVSDNFIWSKDGTGTGAPTLLEAANYGFITGVPGLWDAANNEFTDEVLDFDEFMAIAQATNATTLVCLPFDRMYNFGGTTVSEPVKNFLISNATSMIQHALDMGYDVDYWQFGNESNLNQNRQPNRGGQDGPAEPEDYARFVLEFIQAIEAALDPADFEQLRFAVNGNGTPWYRRILEYPGLSGYIDAVTPHAYQFGVLDFDDYVVNRTNLVERVEEARAAIANASIPQSDKDRIEMVVTEYGAFRYESFDEDVDPRYDQSDIARSIMLFEITASLLREPDVRSIMHWVTRWIGNENEPIIRATDSLDDFNGLAGNGVALEFILERLSGAMVGVTVDPALIEVNAYAIADDVAGGLTVFMVNRTDQLQAAGVAVPAGIYTRTLGATEYFGDELSPYDRTPTRIEHAPEPVSGGGITTISLRPYSITLIDFGPCSPADLAAPRGALGSEDVLAFGDVQAPTDPDGFAWAGFLNEIASGCP